MSTGSIGSVRCKGANLSTASELFFLYTSLNYCGSTCYLQCWLFQTHFEGKQGTQECFGCCVQSQCSHTFYQCFCLCEHVCLKINKSGIGNMKLILQGRKVTQEGHGRYVLM